MSFKGLMVTLGVGAVVGAVAVMMLPQDCNARKLANKAADAVEDAAQNAGAKLSQKMDF